MKNIHVLPTDKPSRLFKLAGDLHLHKECGIDPKRNQNIYITSDEEIKKDEYYLGEDNNIYCLVTTVNFNGKKIILTTDQDLIKDGVQAIVDEFLEWFVKNQSCEVIKVELEIGSLRWTDSKSTYKIIIPKEEFKQKWDINTCIYWDMEIGCEKETCICENTEPKQELERGITITHVEKQETLEEAAERFADECNSYDGHLIANGVEFGAKWQQERMYSEEDMIEASKYGYNFHKTTQFPNQEFEDSCIRNTQQWFEQFRKRF